MQFVRAGRYFRDFDCSIDDDDSSCHEITFSEFQRLWLCWFSGADVIVSPDNDWIRLQRGQNILFAVVERIPLTSSAVLAEQNRLFLITEAIRDAKGG